MTVTIARMIVTVTADNIPSRNLTHRSARRRSAASKWAAGCALACGWLWSNLGYGQDSSVERFDLKAAPVTVRRQLGPEYRLPSFRQFHGNSPVSQPGQLTASQPTVQLEQRASTSMADNPLRRQNSQPTLGQVSPLETASISPKNPLELGSQAAASQSSSPAVSFQELPHNERQIAHAESYQFDALPPVAGDGITNLEDLIRLDRPLGGSIASAQELPAVPGDMLLAARQLEPERPDAGSAVTQEKVPAVQEWWRMEVASEICQLPESEKLDVETLIQLTLRGSPRLQAISQEPLVRDEDSSIARADFDPVLFARTLYDDRTDPVGNTLTTGGLPFLKDNIWTGQAGIRRKYFTGGKIEASQLLGFQNSNSRFFVPQDQGTATLAINLQQPLLRGAGQTYNRSQIVIAQLNAGASWDDVAGQLQDELSGAVITYWELYASRARYLQLLRNYNRGVEVLKRLEARADYDVQALQLAQARAAVSSRNVELANALRDIRNAETEIRRIVGDSQLANSDQIELLTTEPPLEVVEPLELSQTVEVALANRPEIRQAMAKLKSAAVRNDVTRNEMLPDLSLLFGTYVKGLQGDSALGQAWQQQFVNSTPGYSAGLQYEFPWRNRAAISRNRQNRLEYVRSQAELEKVTVDVIADNQKKYRTLKSAIETLNSARIALDAAWMELSQIQARWEAFPLIEGDWYEGQTQSLLLDQLLNAQQKVTEHEREVTNAEVEMKRAQIALKRAMGTVLDYYQVNKDTVWMDGMPQIEYNASGLPLAPGAEMLPNDDATAPLNEIK
jgi:outer membrane protein TolC